MDVWVSFDCIFLLKGFVLDDERLKNPAGWDYFDELLARIRAVLRRPQQQEAGEEQAEHLYSFGDFQMDSEAQRLVRNGREVDLTSGEFTLLETLVRHPNRVLSRDQLVDLTPAGVDPQDLTDALAGEEQRRVAYYAVGAPGRNFKGVAEIRRKAEWPSWTPTAPISR